MSSSRFSLFGLLLLAVLAFTLLGSARACGPSCMTGYYYLEKPNFNYTSNGCGSYGVEVSAPFGANMCCMQHDYCYSNCSTTKSACDTNLDTCMKSQCGTLNSTFDTEACQAQADLFYTAVMDLGCPAYTSAQDQACECSLTKNYTNSNTTYYFSGAGAQYSSVQAMAGVAVLLVLSAFVTL